MAVVCVESHGPVRWIRLDDGKANALDPSGVRELRAALDEAEADAEVRVLAILGRPERFCVGLDNGTLQAGGAAANELLACMGELLHGLYASPLLVVAGCTGHAVAAGAMLLLVSDWRVGVRGDYRVGFSEVGIGMPLPELPILLARDRLSPRYWNRATVTGELFGPDLAVDAGFLDRLVAPSELEAQLGSEAERLAALRPEAVAPTASALRGASLARMPGAAGAPRA